MVDGLDQRGTVFDSLPQGVRQVVAFAIAGPDAAAELTFWRRVAADSLSEVFFVGFCLSGPCRTPSDTPQAHFVVLVEGEVSGLAVIAKASRNGSFFVTDANARIIARLSARHVSPAELAAKIKATR